MRALAFYHGWWGVRPKSPVTSQPPSLVDLLYREDPHILCFREACQRPSLPSLFGMPYGHSLSCLLIRRYHMSAVTFCLLLCVPRYQLAQTPVSPHGAAGQHKQTPFLLTKCPPSLNGTVQQDTVAPRFHLSTAMCTIACGQNLFESWSSGELPQRGVSGELGSSEQS